MANYNEKGNISGKWIKGSEIKTGVTGKLVSETKPQPSQFKDKNGNIKIQDVAKIQIEGENEPLNINLNRASLNALVNAFGNDSVKWQGHALVIETEKMRVGGKAVVAVYLIPDGYERKDDENGYAVIPKIGEKVETPPEDDFNFENE